MESIIDDFEKLKISAFSKLVRLSGDIHTVTIGPNRCLNKTRSPEPKPEPETQKLEAKASPVSRINNVGPVRQVLRELETQRQQRVQQAISDRRRQFEEFSKSLDQNQWVVQQQKFIEGMRQQEVAIQQALQQHAIDRRKENERLVKHYQDALQRKLQMEQQLEKTREKQRILNENMEKIKRCQVECRAVYQEIVGTIKTCTSNEELKKLAGEELKLLNMLPERMDEVIVKCKSCDLGDDELKQAVMILRQVRDLKGRFEEAVVRINAKKEEEAKPEEPAKAESKPEAATTVLEQYISLSNFRKYSEIQQFCAHHSHLFKELLEDEQLKQFKFDCKKAVNIPVNALSAVSPEHLKDKYVRLSSLLQGKNVVVGDRQINAARHPQGIAFCKDLLARKFVLQGDLMISSNPEAAYCYAAMIVALWNDFPDFGKLLLGCFYTQCPYVVPFHIPKTDEQSAEEYYASLGYQFVNGQIEKQDKFLKRMTGILRLYFAIWTSKPKREHSKNPHDIRHAWMFLVSLLRLEPRPDITATILHTFLETVGFEMENVYGASFKKLVRIIAEKFMPAVKKIDSGGPVTRLEVLLQDYSKNGRFEKPHGTLPTNFW